MFLVCVLSSCIKFMFWIRFRLMFCVRVPRSCSTFMFCIHVPCSNSYICRQKKLYWISYLSFQIWNLGSQFRLTFEELHSGYHLKLTVQASSSYSEFMFRCHIPSSWSEVMIWSHGPRTWSEVMVRGHGSRSWSDHCPSSEKFQVMTLTLAFQTSTNKFVLLWLALEHCWMWRTSW